MLAKLSENRRIVLLTFEIFWIAVFILDRMTRATAGQIAQFQYVNF